MVVGGLAGREGRKRRRVYGDGGECMCVCVCVLTLHPSLCLPARQICLLWGQGQGRGRAGFSYM